MAAIPEKFVIGFDLGGTNMAAGLFDARLDMIESLETETPTASQDELLAAIVSMVRDVSSRASTPVSAVGFGIPSMIDQQRGRAVMSVNVPLSDCDFVDYMQSELGLPVFIDNDANVAALAEVRAGAARGSREVIMITLGTGIGGGIIIGGRVYRGATGSAAELGHMVVEAHGPRCQGTCENYGCFETMASGTALKRYSLEESLSQPDSALAQALDSGKAPDGALLTSLALEDDTAAIAVYSKIGFYTGVGMTSLVNIFNPEVFVIGGGLIKAGELILAPARRVLAERGLRPNRDLVKVVPARFGADAGLVGAACLALDELANADRSQG